MEISTLYQIFLNCGTVTTDSRNCPKGSLFIALKGDSFNGNAFAAQALMMAVHMQSLTKQAIIQKMTNVIFWWTTVWKRYNSLLIITVANWAHAS